MSVSGNALDFEPVQQTGVVAALRRKLGTKRNLWGLADQVLISASNFITMVLLARGLSKSAFGQFTLVYTGLLLINLVQGSLITQPHNVLAAPRLKRKLKSYLTYTTSTAASQILLAGLETLVAGLFALVGYLMHWSVTSLLVVLAPTIVAWQLQEFVRRVLYSEGRIGAAFANDLLSYGGQAIAFSLLWWEHRLTGTLGMGAIAATSGAATVLGLWQIWPSLRGRIRRGVFQVNWGFGKWLLGSELLSWCASLSAYLYIAGLMLGVWASGDLKAVQTLFGPARIFSFFLCTILPIQFARTLAEGGASAVHRQLCSISWGVIPLMAAYCLLIALCSRPILSLVYGPDYAGSATILIMYSVVAFLSYLQMLISAALLARRMTHLVFIGSCWAAGMTAVISWPLIYFMRLPGALLAMLLTQSVVTIVLYLCYRQIHSGVDPISARNVSSSIEKPVATVA